jgi:acylphosphatase
MRVLVHGRVQGVNFRWFAKAVAVRLGIVGFVRNMQEADTVEVLAQGTSQQLQAYVACLREGPPAARVTDVTVDWDCDDDDSKYPLFEIRY